MVKFTSLQAICTFKCLSSTQIHIPEMFWKSDQNQCIKHKKGDRSNVDSWFLWFNFYFSEIYRIVSQKQITDGTGDMDKPGLGAWDDTSLNYRLMGHDQSMIKSVLLLTHVL